MIASCIGCRKEYDDDSRQRLLHRDCSVLYWIARKDASNKEAIKADYFGLDEFKVGEKWYRAVKPSEQAERAEYADLITYTMQWAAENCEYVFEDAQ